MRFAYSILLLVFSVIILCEMAGIYFLYEYKNSLEDQIVRDSEKVDVMMVNRIDSYAIERMIDLTNLGKSGTFEVPLENSDANFSHMSNPGSYMDEMNSKWAAAPGNTTTPLMDAYIESGPSEQLRQIQSFDNIKFGGKIFDDIFMTNSYGANVVEMGRTATYAHDGEEWWKQAKDTGQYMGGLEFDKNSGGSSYVTAIQLNDEQGDFIGVARAVVDTQPMIEIMRSQMNWTDPIPWQYEMIGSGGTVIYSSDPTESPGSMNHELNYSNQLTDKTGNFVQTIDGVDYLVTYSHSANSKFSPLFDWVFVTKYKMSDIMKPVSDLSNLVVTVIIVLLVTVSTTVFVLSRKLARPIENLRKGLVAFNEGRGAKIEAEGEEEVSDLIRQFNRIVESRSGATGGGPESVGRTG
ncbi:MAG TPA: PDC sensor domain-containing protein [Candidatus Nitrosotalea sp.]|nr:PDC sensor domain-containing protein [Candidatus Nitrosotalea sp.]